MEEYSELSDVQLAGLLKSGDHYAFTQLYNRYWAVLYHHAVKMLKDEDQAVDVLQDVFTAIWVKRSKLNISSSVRAYLYAAVRNKIVSNIRHNKVYESYLDSLTDLIDKGEFVTDEQLCYKELITQIENEVNKLPPKMREVFELSRNDGLSHSQIAKKLNIADQTVKKQIYKALKALKIKLDIFLFAFLF